MAMRYDHDHENDVIYFGKTNFRNQLSTFGIKTDDRRRHVYIVGKTGMGKTTLIENMFLSDVYAGHGCCFIDPHGDTAEKLVDYIPSWRINDVVYFNPSDLKHPIGFNILESVDVEMRHLVAAGMMSVFKKLWENVWSARMEYILNNTILALLDTPGTTLLGINRMLSDSEYRKMIVANVKDPIVKQFWVQEFANYEKKFASEAVAPIQNKVGQFLSAAIIRNIVAQAKSTINIRKVMDDEMILIINLSKGRIGEDASHLLGGMLITKIQMSAMERVDMPEEDRRDFYLYVDEFQNFAVESFASILSEARKYRLNLIMAHQYIAQLTEEVRDAVFGNVGTLISFRVGSPDAVFMEAEFMPRFLPEDIINLPKYGIYLKLMIDGVTSMPFSATTLPPIGQLTSSREKVVEQSRERYGGNRAEIESHVAKWSGFGEDVDLEVEYKAIKDRKKQEKKDRFSHDYDCTRCKKVFKLPVELDRSRPIYCEDCMPIIQEERKKRKDRKPSRPERKIDSTPKLREGEVIKKDIGKSMSLSALVEEKSDEKNLKLTDRQTKQKTPLNPPLVKGETESKIPTKTEIKETIKVGEMVQEQKPKKRTVGEKVESQKHALSKVEGSKVESDKESQKSKSLPDRQASENRDQTNDQDQPKRKRKRRSRSRGGKDRNPKSPPDRKTDENQNLRRSRTRLRLETSKPLSFDDPAPDKRVAPGQIVKFDK